MFSGEIPNKRAPRFQHVWITVSNWQALVIQKVDNAIHCINLYPAHNAVGIHNTYPLDSELSGGLCYRTFNQPGPEL